MYELTAGSYSLEGISYASFGIRFGGIVFEDVSPDKQAVERLVALCNTEKLDKIHLRDVVLDFLGEWSSDHF